VTSEPAGGPSPVRRLLRNGGYWQWSVATQAYRLPGMMAPLAFVLAAKEGLGSVAVGGVLVTVYTIAPAVTGPFAGRLYDRAGVATWAPRVIAAVAAGLVVLAAAMALGAPNAVLIGLATLVAAATGGLGGCLRTLLSERVPERLLPAALSVDSSAIELTIVGAPLIVAAVAVLGPFHPVFAMGLFMLLSGLLLRAGRFRGAARAPEGTGDDAEPPPAEAVDGRGLWQRPRFLFWLLAAAAFGQSLGTLEIGALPLAERLGGGNGTAALLVAVLGVASGLSGLGFAVVESRLRARAVTRAVTLLAVMAAAGLAVGFAGTLGVAVALYVLIGLCTAPLNATVSVAVEKDVPPGRRTEAFSTIVTTNAIGFAIPGVLLATVGMPGMVRLGAVLATTAVLIAPVLYGRRRSAGDETDEAPARVAGA